ncbi:MAG: DNA-directed RNA polymerase subunit omega [Salinisphaeraceae bacterium]|nr:DNA-directed RNA polymerase subunit omega [Salinisphaeraceae bacterium]
MARVTVEDCLHQMDNQFDLTLVAAKRARQLARGADAKVGWDNDKPTVVALREISEGLVDKTVLNEEELPLVPVTPAGLAAMEVNQDNSLDFHND